MPDGISGGEQGNCSAQFFRRSDRIQELRCQANHFFIVHDHLDDRRVLVIHQRDVDGLTIRTTDHRYADGLWHIIVILSFEFECHQLSLLPAEPSPAGELITTSCLRPLPHGSAS